MRIFSFSIFIGLFFLLLGCESSEVKSCPQCHMPVTSQEHSAKLLHDGEVVFDDIGCMVLYVKDKSIDLDKAKALVFTNDTKKYLLATKAYYLLGEETPMRYGFGAYEHEKKGSMRFGEVYLKMLRGENMSNPKIRKKIKLAEGYGR